MVSLFSFSLTLALSQRAREMKQDGMIPKSKYLILYELCPVE